MKTKEEIEGRILETEKAIEDNKHYMDKCEGSDITICELEDYNLKLRYRIKVLKWVLN